MSVDYEIYVGKSRSHPPKIIQYRSAACFSALMSLYTSAEVGHAYPSTFKHHDFSSMKEAVHKIILGKILFIKYYPNLFSHPEKNMSGVEDFLYFLVKSFPCLRVNLPYPVGRLGIIVDPNYDSSEIIVALSCIRMVDEYQNVVKRWIELVDMGINPRLAFFIAPLETCPEPTHYPLNISYIPTEAVLTWVHQGESSLRVVGDTYNQRLSYENVHKTYWGDDLLVPTWYDEVKDLDTSEIVDKFSTVECLDNL